jgi:hypothetical protein
MTVLLLELADGRHVGVNPRHVVTVESAADALRDEDAQTPRMQSFLRMVNGQQFRVNHPLSEVLRLLGLTR